MCHVIKDKHGWRKLQCKGLFMKVTMENIQASGL